MELTLHHGGKTYLNAGPDDLAKAGVPASDIGAAAKAFALGRASAFADRYRAELASASANRRRPFAAPLS